MKRITITLLDSFGIGSAKDADKFGDAGSDTLGHIAQWCSENRKDSNGAPLPLSLPNLNRLGLGHAAKSSTGQYPIGLDETISPIALYGYAQEISSGKDTPSGHWEIAGAPVLYDWGYFPEMNDSFPKELLQKIYEQNNLTASLANSHASGTAVLDELGEQHMQSGHPIFYTSVDSVFQIACHEETFGLEKLYALCESVREILTEDGYNIGRVIARPFIGDSATGFVRTGNRKDYAVEPPHMTVLEKLVREKNGDVISIGKIADIYAHVGITQKFKATGIPDLFDQTLKIMDEFKNDDTIIFTNFVNFDSDFGHRRDPAGYAEALEYFDSRLPEILSRLSEDELLIITADHGCDPTWHGGDHTREHIPVIVYSPSIKGRDIGGRKTFADIGQTIADYFELSKMDYGQSFLK